MNNNFCSLTTKDDKQQKYVCNGSGPLFPHKFGIITNFFIANRTNERNFFKANRTKGCESSKDIVNPARKAYSRFAEPIRTKSNLLPQDYNQVLCRGSPETILARFDDLSSFRGPKMSY